MTVKIFHNPRCSKSRQTLQLLRDNGVEPEIVEYLNQPPSAKELKGILDLLGMEPRALMRRGEAVFKENGLGDKALTGDQLVVAMTKHPILIERPIVLANGKAAIGRPPESVLDIV